MESFVVFDILLFSVTYFLFLPFIVFQKWKPPLKWQKPCWNGCFTYSH